VPWKRTIFDKRLQISTVYVFIRDHVSSFAPNILQTVTKMLVQNITESLLEESSLLLEI
jgi:hypothetical protein